MSPDRLACFLTSSRTHFRRAPVSAKDLQQCQNVEARACNELALMKLDWTQGGLVEGLRCYRSREFFAAHEHWESVWLATKGPEKAFLQALIQLAAALHRIQRGNPGGAASLLGSALRDLSPTRCCSEALLCHRSAKKFANGCKGSKQEPHGLSARFRRSDCADRCAVWPRQTSVGKNGRG